MPLYEGIGLISEKHAVVIDIGSAYTKAGFAGETGPRCIIPSEVVHHLSSKVTRIADYENGQHLYHLLVDFIHHLYFKHLLVNPKDRRIVIVESVLCPTLFRETLARVLFQHFEVSSLVFVPTHLMTLFTLGISSALIVDVGYEETQVFPIYDGVLMLNSGETVPLAAKAIHRSIKNLLMDGCTIHGPEENALTSSVCSSLDDKTLEDIKVRACFVTTFKRGNWLQNQPASGDAGDAAAPVPPPDVLYPLEGDKIIHIPGICREKACEVLFELDNDMKSVATVILDTILKCPIDMRIVLMENIVLVGGTALFPGFKARLKSEILSLLTHPHYNSKLSIKKCKFHRPPAKENYTAWLGAAVFGATDVITTRSLTREQYMQHKIVPDWSNLSRLMDDDGRNISY